MLKAVIFDFDGVIVDSEPIHCEMLQQVLAEEGIQLSVATYQERYLAFDDKTCFATVFADHRRPLAPAELERLIGRKAELVKNRLGAGGIVFPGVPAFIRGLSELPLAINSGALRAEIELVLAAKELRLLFPTIVSAEDVSFCKPHPEGYLLALERLNSLYQFNLGKIVPAECLVIEDSVHGIESARRAGMKCLAVTNSYPAEALGHADKVVASLEGITVRDLRGWAD